MYNKRVASLLPAGDSHHLSLPLMLTKVQAHTPPANPLHQEPGLISSFSVVHPYTPSMASGWHMFWIFFRRFMWPLFWMLVRLIFRSGLNLWNSFDIRSGNILEFSRAVTTTPNFHKIKTPGGMKKTLSSLKRHNRRSTDADFEGKARRELFKVSPVKFLLDNEKFRKLPKRNTIRFDVQISQQKRLRL